MNLLVVAATLILTMLIFSAGFAAGVAALWWFIGDVLKRRHWRIVYVKEEERVHENEGQRRSGEWGIPDH